MALKLLEKGHVYGKQFVIFLACRAYPTYVVTYSCPRDFPAKMVIPRTRLVDRADESVCSRNFYILFLYTPIIFFFIWLLSQMPLKWAYKSKSQNSWIPYPPQQSIKLSQVIICTNRSVLFTTLKLFPFNPGPTIWSTESTSRTWWISMASRS